MTNYALSIYRMTTRFYLKEAVGREVTNAEHNAFLVRLNLEVDQWVRTEAKKETEKILNGNNNA